MPAPEYKRCTTCGETKSREHFSLDRRRKDGLRGECKGCIAAWRQANADGVALSRKRWREKNRAHVAQYNKEWQAQHPERMVAATKRWDACHPQVKRVRERRHAELNPEKVAARRAVRSAVRSGALIKPDHCEECGQQTERRELQGHHEDYAKPLEVDWLCRTCHLHRHRSERTQNE